MPCRCGAACAAAARLGRKSWKGTPLQHPTAGQGLHCTDNAVVELPRTVCVACCASFGGPGSLARGRLAAQPVPEASQSGSGWQSGRRTSPGGLAGRRRPLRAARPAPPPAPGRRRPAARSLAECAARSRPQSTQPGSPAGCGGGNSVGGARGKAGRHGAPQGRSPLADDSPTRRHGRVHAESNTCGTGACGTLLQAAHLEAREARSSGGGSGAVGPRKLHPVPLRQLKHEVGLQRALNVLGQETRAQA